MPEITSSEWDQFLCDYPDAHLLQTSGWGDLKSSFGWDVVQIISKDIGEQFSGIVGAQVLFRRLPLGFSLAYIPKGPVFGEANQDDFSNWEVLWLEVDKVCRRRRAIFLMIEPDLWEPPKIQDDDQHFQDEVVPNGFLRSQQAIQPSRTLVVDLRGDEDQILARMKQKTRYNVRLAMKKGVVTYPTADVDSFYRMMVATGKRDGFGVHSLEYYHRAYDIFHPRGECELIMAEYQEKPLAALMVFARGTRAWYFYGASSGENRESMPNHLLQWEAMRWARNQGCGSYDLWGVPDFEELTLETNFPVRSDGLWGIYRFKRGFGGQLFRASGPWNRVYKPILYTFYRWWVRNRAQE